MATHMTPIGYLVPEFPGQTHAFFWREVTALRKLGCHVEMFSTRRPPPEACHHAFAPEAAGATRYLFPPRLVAAARLLLTRPVRTLNALRYITGLSATSARERVRFLGLLCCAADLVSHAEAKGVKHLHIHSCADSAHLGALSSLLGTLRYSLSLHGDLDVYGTDHVQKMRRAQFVACVTRPLQRQVFEATDLPPDRVPVLWMGVDTQRFRPTPGRNMPHVGALRALTVARLHTAKGHRFALLAIAKLRDEGVVVDYQIAGEGPARRDIERQIEDLNLGDQVTLVGTQAEDSVLGLLQASDVLILTSIGQGEAAPVAVMEAMACGLAVVCSIIGGTPDMIEDGVDGLLTPQEDVSAIATHLRSLAIDPALRQRIAHAARRKAEAAFDATDLAKRLWAQIELARPIP